MITPILSIVIANYNYGRFLEEAILSVLNQSCQDFELIIVDGGSTDNSVEIIQAFSDRLGGVRFWGSSKALECGRGELHRCANSKMRKSATENGVNLASENNFRTPELQNSGIRFLWCSEKDRGQSHAFNKGFAHATGEFITWINADDLMPKGTLAAVKDKLMRTGADWATGNLVRFDMATQKLTEVNWGPHWLPAFMQGKGWPVAVYGPTTFWRRSVFEKLGPMDETCFFAMDTEYWIRMFMHGYKHVRVNAFCWAFRMHEESKTAEFGDHHHQGELLKKKTAEKIRIQVQNGFHVSGIKHRISQLWRLLDGSFIHEKILQRQWIGKTLQEFVQS